MKKTFQLKFTYRKKVIFVDWHGVISNEPFWQSIHNNKKHPLANKIRHASKKIFSSEDSMLEQWMRGEIDSKQIIATMNIRLDKRFSNDFLIRRLISDCKNMVCNAELINFLKQIRQKAFIVLATDNMDCFSDALNISRKYHRSIPNSGLQTMRSIINNFDEILCSADLGVLKSEDSNKFFGTWLSWHGISFEKCLLIDDRKDNLMLFEKMGGKSVLYKQNEKEMNEITFKIIKEWIDKN